MQLDILWWFSVGICKYKQVINHMTCYNLTAFNGGKIIFKNPLQNLPSSLNAVIYQ